jgi:hypothetical protein
LGSNGGHRNGSEQTGGKKLNMVIYCSAARKSRIEDEGKSNEK